MTVEEALNQVDRNDCRNEAEAILAAEVRRLREEQGKIALAGLATLAGVVCTPVEGYKKAGLNWFVNDVRSLVKLHEKTSAENDRYREALELIAQEEESERHQGGGWAPTRGVIIAKNALRGGEEI